MLENNKIGLEEKAPIHVADVVRMMEESWFRLSSVTTLKNNYYGGAILASHDTSEKESGYKSTRKSGNLPDTQMVDAKSDDQVQPRVKFSVKNSVEISEPDARVNKLGTTWCEPIVWK